MRKHYIGLIHTAGPTAYGVSFPDFPGTLTAARTIDEAVEHAREVLALHAEGMLADGEPIPPPSSFEDVKMLAPDYRNAMLVLVPLEVSGGEAAPALLL